MQPSSFSDIIQRLRELGAFADDEHATAALALALGALGSLLTNQEREALADALPSDLAQILRYRTQEAQASSVDTLGETKRREACGLREERAVRRAPMSPPGWRRLLSSL